jgi:predicted nucleic acid-binding protein
MMVVIDASAWVEYLLRTPAAARFEATVEDESFDLHVPALCDVEVCAGLRRCLLAGEVTFERAAEALDDYLDLPIERHGHIALVPRLLELRANFSAYDATYVALVESMSGALITEDRRFARAVREHLPSLHLI